MFQLLLRHLLENTIRGQTALNRELSSDQAVGITINGAPITRGTNLFSNLFDVDQIEVLKGPQGTLFGKNTTGGAVIVTTTAPKLGEFEAYAEADFGNFGRRDFEGVFNVPVGDNLAIRIGAASQFRDGFAFGVRRENIDTSNPELHFLFEQTWIIMRSMKQVRARVF